MRAHACLDRHGRTGPVYPRHGGKLVRGWSLVVDDLPSLRRVMPVVHAPRAETLQTVHPHRRVSRPARFVGCLFLGRRAGLVLRACGIAPVGFRVPNSRDGGNTGQITVSARCVARTQRIYFSNRRVNVSFRHSDRFPSTSTVTAVSRGLSVR